IKDNIARNRPYDEFVRGIIAAAGEWQDAPAINWYWQMRDDQLHQVTADTAQVFLGVRLQCARCHHHPYERWGQEDYYGLAGFFTGIGAKGFPEGSQAILVKPGADLKQPRTGEAVAARALGAPAADFSGIADRRQVLVTWMT